MRMFALSGLVFAVTASFVVTPAQSADVLVLVHGLGGWGEQEFLGFPYWSYRGVLEDEGLTTKVAALGKFTSNWDRACELYAQIKGTVVDYGVCHSREAGHLRFGKNYTGQGLYPQWDASNRVHLMGHSMGAQTMRMIERLLQKGSGCSEDVSPLFTGKNRNWIRSITTISGTSDGTSFVDIMGETFSNFVADLVVAIAAISEGNFIEDLYDVDMAQWGIVRKPGENFKDFWSRAFDSGVATPGNKDFSMYELSEVGARDLNDQTDQTYDGTYYFAIATERTNKFYYCILFWCKPYELPDPLMIPFLWFSASVIGKSSQPQIKQKNDGLVPWHDQICPSSSTYDKSTCIEFKGTWKPKQWHYLTVPTLDHLQIILPNTLTDTFNYNNGPKKVYTDHARRLKGLPGSTPLVSSNEGDDDTTSQILHLTKLSAESQSDQKMRLIGTVVNSLVGVIVGLVLVFLGRRYILRSHNKKETINEDTKESVSGEPEPVVAKRSSVIHYVSESGDIEENPVEGIPKDNFDVAV